tara:strand:- start:2702 stop:2803 length:102 start_codon:yes stop_codon:yes gene_type:complete
MKELFIEIVKSLREIIFSFFKEAFVFLKSFAKK